MNLAIIEDDTVVNVIICASIEEAYAITKANEIIDSDANNAFMNYKRIEGVWVNPELLVS